MTENVIGKMHPFYIWAKKLQFRTIPNGIFIRLLLVKMEKLLILFLLPNKLKKFLDRIKLEIKINESPS